MKKKVLVIVGHPKNDSFCAALAESYQKGAKKAGHEVKMQHISDLDIKLLRNPQEQEENPEKDVVKAQADVRWADHLVFVYPTWWAAMPAITKSYFERVYAHDFAFRYKKEIPYWDMLLKGRTARVIVTMDAPYFVYKYMMGAPGHKMIKKGILEFCGIKPVKFTNFGSVRKSTEEKRKKWLLEVERLGEKAL